MSRRLRTLFALGLAVLGLPTVANAITIDVNALPAEVRDCANTGSCLFGPGGYTSLSDHNGASLFTYRDLSGATVTQKFLVRYALTDAYQISFDIVTDSSGYIWLGGDVQYDTSNPVHDFTLYVDQVSPLPRDLTNSGADGSPIHLGLTSSDLLAGGASWSIFAEELDGFVVHESGSLITDGVTSSASLCLAGGCGADAHFNTVMLQFLDGGSTLNLLPALNTADFRSLLYQQRTYYDDGSGPFYNSYEEQWHSVQVVPIPPAAWLFVSGLALLLARSRAG